jgi:hypothetical protein
MVAVAPAECGFKRSLIPASISLRPHPQKILDRVPILGLVQILTDLVSIVKLMSVRDRSKSYFNQEDETEFPTRFYLEGLNSKML